MAATYTLAARMSPSPDRKEGNRRRVVRDITLSGTYTTGGDALLPSVFGMKKIEEFIVHGSGATDGTLLYTVYYIYSSNKLQLFETGSAAAGSAEKGSGESLTGITFRATVVGW